MKALTRKELVELGGTVQDSAGVFGSVKNTTAYLNGETYLHETNDYQEGAGNCDDYQMFRLVIKHHSSLTRGYVSRKNSKGESMHYVGRFGKGVKVFTPNFNSTRYCYVTYYVEA